VLEQAFLRLLEGGSEVLRGVVADRVRERVAEVTKLVLLRRART